MKIAVLDFETYYSDEYTLKKLTTEGYIRDPRFKVHCVAVKVAEEVPPPGENPVINTQVMDHATFKPVAHYANQMAVVCHKAQFDGLIMSHHYDVRPAFFFDTLSMARLVWPHAKSHSLEAIAERLGLPAKTVPYNEFRGKRDLDPEVYQKLAAGAAHDVELTWLVFRHLLPMIPREELRIIDMTIRMFTEPCLELDYAGLEQYYEHVKSSKNDILDNLGVSKAELQSSDKFAGLLKQLGVVPPVKPSGTDPTKTIYAFAKTDEEMKELLEHEDDKVSTLCAARLGQKSTLNETRCERLLRMAERGKLCVPLRYAGAGASLRFSGEDKVNFQNFPRSGEIRRCLMAPVGYVLLVGDLSQIECRMLNWLAGEQWVLDAFREKRDLYSEIASQFYGRTITKEDKAQRGLGKQVELSCGFGSGGAKIAITARRGTYGPPVMLSDADGLAWRDLYRRTHPHVVQLWEHGRQMLECLFHGGSLDYGPLRIRDKKVYGPNGAWLDYSNLISKGVDPYNRQEFAVMRRQGEARIYGSKFIQNVIEFLSRQVLVTAMLEMQASGYKALMCTHDEGVHLVPEAEADKAAALFTECLTRTPPWCPGIPLECEGGYDRRYVK